MDAPSESTPPEDPPTRDPRPGWFVTAFGIALIIWATLSIAGAGYGSRPKLNFAERRSYDMVKRDVHRAFPLSMLKAATGLALIFVGAKMRKS